MRYVVHVPRPLSKRMDFVPICPSTFIIMSCDPFPPPLSLANPLPDVARSFVAWGPDWGRELHVDRRDFPNFELPLTEGLDMDGIDNSPPLTSVY